MVIAFLSFAITINAETELRRAIMRTNSGTVIMIRVVDMTTDQISFYMANLEEDYSQATVLAYPAKSVSDIQFEDGKQYRNYKGQLLSEEQISEIKGKNKGNKTSKSNIEDHNNNVSNVDKKETSIKEKSETPVVTSKKTIAYDDVVPQEIQNASIGTVVYNHGHFYLNGEWLDNKEYEKLLRLNSQTAYAYQQYAKLLRNAGIGVTASGLAELLVIGLPCYIDGKDNNKNMEKQTGNAFIVVGAASIVAGAVCWGIGSVRIKKSATVFNSCMQKKGVEPTLNFNIGVGQVGCSLDF